MKNILLTFDIEEFDLPLEYGIKISGKEKIRVPTEGTKKILELLEKHKIKATFFLTAEFALSNKKIVKEIAKKNPIACHGFFHSENYYLMRKEKILLRLRKAKEVLEKITGKEVYAFRSPKLQWVDYKIIKKAGFDVDSSLLPTFIHLGNYKLGRLENLFRRRQVHDKKGIRIFPLAVTPLFSLPLVWITFRNLGLDYAKICTLFGFIGNNNFVLNFHPWEFIDISKMKLPFLIRRKTGQYLELLLEKYILWCKKQGFKFATI